MGLTPGLGRSPEEGNGNPLQYCCLGNPMGRGVQWATVCGVARSGTEQWNNIRHWVSWVLGNMWVSAWQTKEERPADRGPGIDKSHVGWSTHVKEGEFGGFWTAQHMWPRLQDGMRGVGAAEAGREVTGRGLGSFVRERGLDLPVQGLSDLGLSWPGTSPRGLRPTLGIRAQVEPYPPPPFTRAALPSSSVSISLTLSDTTECTHTQVSFWSADWWGCALLMEAEVQRPARPCTCVWSLSLSYTHWSSVDQSK